MAVDPTIELLETFNAVLIIIAFAIFTRLAFKGKSLGNFRLQLSIFLLIWAVSEIPHISASLGLIAIGAYEDTGLYLHAASMAVFAAFVGWKSLRLLSYNPPSPAPTLSLPTDPRKGLKT